MIFNILVRTYDVDLARMDLQKSQPYEVYANWSGEDTTSEPEVYVSND